MPQDGKIKPVEQQLKLKMYDCILNNRSFNSDLKNVQEWLNQVAYAKLVVKGKPISYKSVRTKKAPSGKLLFYNPLKEKKTLTQWNFSIQYLTKEILKQPIAVCYIFSFTPPKSMSKKKKDDLIRENAPYHKRKDTDNMCKFYNDCLQSVVVSDDQYIWKTHVEKIYDYEDKVTIYILT